MFTNRAIGALPAYRYPLVNFRSIQVMPYNPKEWYWFYNAGSNYFIIPDEVYARMSRQERVQKRVEQFSTMDFGGNEEAQITSVGLVRGFLKSTKWFTSEQRAGKQSVYRVMNTDLDREIPAWTTQSITASIEDIGYAENEATRNFVSKFTKKHKKSLMKVLSREYEYLLGKKITNITIDINPNPDEKQDNLFLLHMETAPFNPKTMKF